MREKKHYYIFVTLFLLLNTLNPFLVTVQLFNRYIVPFDYSLWGFVNAFFGNLGIILLIFWITNGIKNSRKQMLTLLMITFVLNGLMFAVNIFNRYYGTTFTLGAMSIFKNPAAGVGATIFWESLKEIVTYYRIILFTPFLMLLSYLIFISRSKDNFVNRLSIKKSLSYLFSITIILLTTFMVFNSKLEKTPLVDSTKSTFATQNLGLYHYHVLELFGYDVKYQYKEEDTEKIKEILNTYNKNKDSYVNYLDGKTYSFSPKKNEIENISGKLIDNLDENESLTGVLEGYDLVLIHLETFNHFLLEIDELSERFVYLNQLLKESYVFNNFYTNVGLGNSFDAEVAILTGLNANGTSNIAWDYNNKPFDFQTIPKLFKEKYEDFYSQSIHGDTKVFYNRDKVHPELFGFDEYYAMEEFLEDGYEHSDYNHDAGNWVSDRALFEKLNERIDELKLANQRFMLFPITMMPHIPYWHDPINGIDGSNPDRDSLFTQWDGKISSQHMRYIKYIDYYDEQFKNMFIKDDKPINRNKTAYLFYGDHGSGMSNGDLDILLGNINDEDKLTSPELRQALLKTIAFLYVPGDSKPEGYESAFNEGLIKGTQSLVRGQTDIYRTLIDLFDLPIGEDDFIYGVHGMSTEPTFSIDNKSNDVITDYFITTLRNNMEDQYIDYNLEKLYEIKSYIITFKTYSDVAINNNLYKKFKMNNKK